MCVGSFLARSAMAMWERLFRALFGERVEISVELGSGYSVEAERLAAAGRLKELCDKIVIDERFLPRDGKTYCNLALVEISRYFECLDFVGKMANEIVDFLADGPPGWTLVNAERAARHALRGGLAVAVKKYPVHGHVAAVYPRECEMSGSWKKLTVFVANAGRVNGIMKASEAFPVNGGEPAYFAYGETA